MYYIDHETVFNDGVQTLTRRFHLISKISIDYVNGVTDFEISSYSTFEELKENINPYLSFLTVNDSPVFSVDVSLFCLRCLIYKENSQFFKARIRSDFSYSSLPFYRQTRSQNP